MMQFARVLAIPLAIQGIKSSFKSLIRLFIQKDMNEHVSLKREKRLQKAADDYLYDKPGYPVPSEETLEKIAEKRDLQKTLNLLAQTSLYAFSACDLAFGNQNYCVSYVAGAMATIQTIDDLCNKISVKKKLD